MIGSCALYGDVLAIDRISAVQEACGGLYHLKNEKNINAEEKSSFTFDDAMAFVGQGELVTA